MTRRDLCGFLGLIFIHGLVLAQVDHPGFIKGGLGYKGNLMVFQANASLSSSTNECGLKFRAPIISLNQTSDQTSNQRVGQIDWKCDAGADLVIGTYFDEGNYQTDAYHVSIFPTLFWIPLSHSMDPMHFKLDMNANTNANAILHVYLSRFSKVAWDQPIGIQIDQEFYQSFSHPGHYTFDLGPGSHTLEVDTFPSLDLEASGIYVTENLMYFYNHT